MSPRVPTSLHLPMGGRAIHTARRTVHTVAHHACRGGADVTWHAMPCCSATENDAFEAVAASARTDSPGVH